MSTKLLVATHNKGKISELADMMRDLAIEWLSLDDVGITFDVVETGRTFYENAALKAVGYAEASGLLTLADDSGLEVDALHGRPGVFTARYGGPELTPVERYSMLLHNIADIAWEQRTARFKCAIVLADAQGEIIGSQEGVCEGFIGWQPAGEGGFGYDPIFYLPDYQQTLAQLPAATKHQISHRGRAMMAIAPLLKQLVASS